jgi:hypothetical protein
MVGVHGIGVRAPSAAAVAAATMGFMRLVHSPKGGMLTKGTMSVIVATGMFDPRTRFMGSTAMVDGARPIEQVIIAPFTTT